MGSFNVPCFATNQSICEDASCRLIPLIQQGSYSPLELTRGDEQHSVPGIAMSTCYADSFWRPAGAFITAYYNDFGRFKLELDPLMRGHVLHMFDQLLRSAYVVEQGEHARHAPPFNLPEFIKEKAPSLLIALGALKARGENAAINADCDDESLDEEIFATWNYMWEAIYKHRVYVSHQGQPRLFTFGVLHERSYQALVATGAVSLNYDCESLEPLAFLRKTMAKAQEGLVKHPLEPNSAVFVKGWRIADTFRQAIGYANQQSGMLTTRASESISMMCEALVHERLSEEEMLDRLVPFLQDQQVYGGLNELNLRFSPIVSGGQDSFNENGLAYTKFVARIGREIVRDRQVEMFGAFRPYLLRADSVAEIDALVDNVGNWDAVIEAVEYVAMDEGFEMSFSCTLELGDLREIMRDEGMVRMSESLVLRAEVNPEE